MPGQTEARRGPTALDPALNLQLTTRLVDAQGPHPLHLPGHGDAVRSGRACTRGHCFLSGFSSGATSAGCSGLGDAPGGVPHEGPHAGGPPGPGEVPEP